MMAEQVWDGRPPTGDGRHPLGTADRSATPLLWTHAQYVRLAWNVQTRQGQRAAERRRAPLPALAGG